MSHLFLPALQADWFLLKDDRLWVDKYEPQSLQDLAVHKRKVDDVRRWLEEAFNENGRSKHRVCRLLISLAFKGNECDIAASTYPHGPCWFCKDDNPTRAHAGNGL